MSASTAAWFGLLTAIVITVLVIGSVTLGIGFLVGGFVGWATKDITEWERRRWGR